LVVSTPVALSFCKVVVWWNTVEETLLLFEEEEAWSRDFCLYEYCPVEFKSGKVIIKQKFI